MSEHFQLDERECERYVKQAMNHDETQHLGTILGYQFSPLQSDLGTIATEFYYMDCDSLLDSILFLFRARKNDRLNDLNRQSIIMITNQMLKQKIGPILMNILCKFAEILCDRNEIYTAQRHMTAKRYIVRVARCLFYVFYNTLLVEDEVRRLLACVRELSNRCKTPISDQNDGIKSQWQYQLFAALVVVQVTQMRALQHDTPLFRRDVNEAPGVGLDPGHDESWDNPLAFDPVRLEDPDFKAPKSMGSDGPDFLAPRAMDSDGPSIWDCRLARGLCSLVYAVLCDGEDSTDNSAHMKRLLDAAANTRAFSYLRICMVPFLQSSSCLDIELQLDLTEALCGFVQRILEILNSRLLLTLSS
jgi:hypothetical protein